MLKLMVFERIKTVIQGLETAGISKERKFQLQKLADYIRKNGDKTTAVTFVCTHNSRRSIFCQVWAQTMAAYYNAPNFHSFSAGTETTQVYPGVLSALSKLGFKTLSLSESENPIYAIKFSHTAVPILGFSKSMTHSINPTHDFAAIMTCSSADDACPQVEGADLRLAIPYEDPKIYDGSPLEQEKYEACCLLIAAEFNYLFKQLK
ncbi:MAG: protein-tyrosine-phosphatase [Flavobacteriaceae bacterium]|nr:protein-tyrosine-phosphatase [Flavobacteriaceae bacterium]